jgi:hypothetical protein
MSGRVHVSTCQRCLEPDVQVFYTQKHGWVCEGCRDRRPLTTHERHQEAADNGIDTWEDYRGER